MVGERPAGAGPDEWHRFRAGWHGAFVALAVAGAGVCLVVSGIGTAARLSAVGIVLALLGWYAVVGVRGIRRDGGWAGPAYLAVAAPLTVALFAVVPVGALPLWVLFPHIWLMLAARRAVVVTCAVVAAIGVVLLAHSRHDGAAVTLVLLQSAVMMAAALAIGLWIGRIIRQSRQRAALVEQLAEARAELGAVSRQAGVLAERERLAREIHDTLAQGFTSVLLLLEAAEVALDNDTPTAARYLHQAQHTARENLAEARALVAALTPPDLVHTSFPEALRRLVQRFGSGAGPRVELAVTGTPRGLPAEHEMALLRMAQESLTNVRRHAGAARVAVTLAYLPGRLSLRIADDGKGFDPEAPHDGYGLAGLKARAQGIGAAATVEAAPGAGVVVHVEVPDALG